MIRRLAIVLCLLTTALSAAGQAVPFVTIRMDAGELAFGGAHVAAEHLLPLTDNIFEAGIGKTFYQTRGINYNLTNLEARVRVIEGFTAGIDYISNSMGEMTLYSDNGQPTGTFQRNTLCAYRRTYGSVLCRRPWRHLQDKQFLLRRHRSRESGRRHQLRIWRLSPAYDL